jgi:hypothetical protein
MDKVRNPSKLITADQIISKERHVGIFARSRSTTRRSYEEIHTSLASWKGIPQKESDRCAVYDTRQHNNLAATSHVWLDYQWVSLASNSGARKIHNTTADMSLTRLQELVQGIKVATKEDWAGYCHYVTNTDNSYSENTQSRSAL